MWSKKGIVVRTEIAPPPRSTATSTFVSLVSRATRDVRAIDPSMPLVRREHARWMACSANSSRAAGVSQDYS